MSSADKLCKQFGLYQARQNVGSDLDPNCLNLMVFLNDFFFEKVDYEKHQQTSKKHACKELSTKPAHKF